MSVRLTQKQLDNILELFNKGFLSREIAKIMEISSQTMWRVSKQLGLKFPKGNKSSLTEEQLFKIKELASENISARQISKILGINYRIIIGAYKRLELIPAGNKLQELTDEQNKQIIELFNKLYGERKIAKTLGITRDAVKKAFKKLGLNNKGRHAPLTAHLILEKKCKICKIIKSIDQFSKRIKKYISFSTICKKCQSKINHIEYVENRSNHPELYISDPNVPRKYNKKYISDYRRNRKKNDPIFDLRCQVSSVIGNALKKNNSNKNGESCLKYLGYSMQELKKHLEKQFEPWMNWNNRGRYLVSKWDDNDPSTWSWQLDHIIPQSDLPYTSMEDDNFKKCWALFNLRPYSAKKNNLDRDRNSRRNNADVIRKSKYK